MCSKVSIGSRRDVPPTVVILTISPSIQIDRETYSHSIINCICTPLIYLYRLSHWLQFYRQNYRHFDRYPLARLSRSIGIYREQSALPQWPAFEMYRHLSVLGSHFGVSGEPTTGRNRPQNTPMLPNTPSQGRRARGAEMQTGTLDRRPLHCA